MTTKQTRRGYSRARRVIDTSLGIFKFILSVPMLHQILRLLGQYYIGLLNSIVHFLFESSSSMLNNRYVVLSFLITYVCIQCPNCPIQH